MGVKVWAQILREKYGSKSMGSDFQEILFHMNLIKKYGFKSMGSKVWIFGAPLVC